MLTMLINYHGNPNMRDGYGISPVFTSAACGRSDCLEILLRAGNDDVLLYKTIITFSSHISLLTMNLR